MQNISNIPTFIYDGTIKSANSVAALICIMGNPDRSMDVKDLLRETYDWGVDRSRNAIKDLYRLGLIERTLLRCGDGQYIGIKISLTF